MKNLIPSEILDFEKADGSFIERELPVVLRGGAKSWPAYEKWSPAFFTEKYGDVEVPMSNYRKDPYQSAKEKPRIKISEYLTLAQRIAAGHSDPNEDLYSAGWFFCRGYCELLKDLNLPSYFKTNWAEPVQKAIGFENRSILFGHPKVESPLHTDSFFVSTYFAMIRGQKRMRLVHPKYSQYVHNGYNVFDDDKLARLADLGVPVYDCTISEGDIVWIPPGWWHHVQNDTFTISITTNFVSSYHFLPFEQQVRAVIIKPLLKLAAVKKECLAQTPGYSMDNLESANYLQLERIYLDHFQGALDEGRGLVEGIAQAK